MEKQGPDQKKNNKKNNKKGKTKAKSLEKYCKAQERDLLINKFNNNKRNIKPKRNKSRKFFENQKNKDYNKLLALGYCKKNGLNLDKALKIIEVTNEQKGSTTKPKKIQYIDEGEIGHGAFGTCYLYTSLEDWQKYAAKIVPKDKLNKDKNKQSIKEEITTQQGLKYEKIVSVKSYSEDDKNVYIILELCKNRSLEDLIKSRGYLYEFEARNYIFQLIQGLKYLHQRKIIHRDLKTNNLLLDDKLELKIGDFGLIGKLNKEKERKHTRCGTPIYMAPEVIKGTEKGYSFEVDIWSMGVIMYHILTGKYPFYSDKNDDHNELYKKILDGHFDFPEKPVLSNTAKNLIQQILVKEQKKRPGLDQILYHDFFHIGSFPMFIDPLTLNSKKDLEEKYKDYISKDKNNLFIKSDFEILYRLIVNNITEVKYEDLQKYTLENNNIKGVDNWITLIHISHKGFCYFELNNGMIGILYKSENNIDNIYDGIQLILNEKKDEFFEIKMPQEGLYQIETHNIYKCPENLQQKFDEFIVYKNKIKSKLFNYENQNTTETILTEENTEKETEKENDENNNTIKEIPIQNDGKEKEPELIYIKNFVKEEYAKIILLSDDTKQVIFKDGIEIFISDKKEIVGYVYKNKKRTFIPLIDAMKNSSRDLTSRLKYIKQSNYRVIKEKLQKKVDNNNNNNNKENIEEEKGIYSEETI